LVIELHIGPDTLQIGSQPPILRPVRISRSRWMAFWRHATVTGIDLLMIGRFLRDDWTATDEEMLELLRKR
jgi:hypothetical protein